LFSLFIRASECFNSAVVSSLDESPKLRELLLIVDDRKEVRAALQRFFEMYFERVLTAATPPEAEESLRTEQPTLLLCDYFLGVEWPPATSLIPAWRAMFPFLARVAIMSGTRSESIGNCPEADAIFEKPLNMREVTEFLLTGLTPVQTG
jgi:CheY-like chemotaxis protein